MDGSNVSVSNKTFQVDTKKTSSTNDTTSANTSVQDRFKGLSEIAEKTNTEVTSDGRETDICKSLTSTEGDLDTALKGGSGASGSSAAGGRGDLRQAGGGCRQSGRNSGRSGRRRRCLARWNIRACRIEDGNRGCPKCGANRVQFTSIDGRLQLFRSDAQTNNLVVLDQHGSNIGITTQDSRHKAQQIINCADQPTKERAGFGDNSVGSDQLRIQTDVGVDVADWSCSSGGGCRGRCRAGRRCGQEGSGDLSCAQSG